MHRCLWHICKKDMALLQTRAAHLSCRSHWASVCSISLATLSLTSVPPTPFPVTLLARWSCVTFPRNSNIGFTVRCPSPHYFVYDSDLVGGWVVRRWSLGRGGWWWPPPVAAEAESVLSCTGLGMANDWRKLMRYFFLLISPELHGWAVGPLAHHLLVCVVKTRDFSDATELWTTNEKFYLHVGFLEESWLISSVFRI